MTECQHCEAKSQLFLCNAHIAELRDMLYDLPRLASHLAEAATGQSKLGEPTRRTKSDEQPMRVNFRASDLVDQVNRTLVRWVQDITEQRGVTYRALRIFPPGYVGYLEPGDMVSEYGSDTAKLAFWLGHHTEAIAGGDDAGMCYDEIHDHMTRILATINRPVPPRFCGPCPAVHPDDDRKRCNYQLTAKSDAIEVTCEQCRTRHKTDDLWQRMLNEVGPMRFTVEEIHTMMSRFGEPLSQRTFQHWRKIGKIQPSGYRRHDGKTTPMYRLSDVINLKYRTAGVSL